MARTKTDELHEILLARLEGKRAHDPLPGDLALQREFKLSRGTVRDAFDRLVREGRVYRKRPGGTFVAPVRKRNAVLIAVPAYKDGVLPTDFPFFLLEFMKELALSDGSFLPVLVPLRDLAVNARQLRQKYESPCAVVAYSQPLRLANAKGESIIRDVPVICVGTDHFLPVGASGALVSERTIAEIALRALLRGVKPELGLFGPRNYPKVVARAAAFRSLARERSLAPPFESESDRGFVEWLRRGRLPRAVFCTTDESAQRLALECLRLGIRIPDRVRLLGVEGAPLSDAGGMPLSQIALPLRSFAAQAVRLLLEAASDGPVRTVLLKPLLRERGSTFAA